MPVSFNSNLNASQVAFAAKSKSKQTSEKKDYGTASAAGAVGGLAVGTGLALTSKDVQGVGSGKITMNSIEKLAQDSNKLIKGKEGDAAEVFNAAKSKLQEGINKGKEAASSLVEKFNGVLKDGEQAIQAGKTGFIKPEDFGKVKKSDATKEAAQTAQKAWKTTQNEVRDELGKVVKKDRHLGKNLGIATVAGVAAGLLFAAIAPGKKPVASQEFKS